MLVKVAIFGITLFNFEGISKNNTLVGVNGDEGPPVPIPNTEVKLIRADNTRLATAREDKAMPTQNGWRIISDHSAYSFKKHISLVWTHKIERIYVNTTAIPP